MYTQDELSAIYKAANNGSDKLSTEAIFNAMNAIAADAEAKLEKAAALCDERALSLNTQGLSRVSDMFTTVARSIRAIPQDSSAIDEAMEKDGK